ncbi:hypothetical protein [Falsarthrobacter nasiphocae]|uniref:Cell division protein FtsL n=1 Tax=Falsarthrobacter nasiphocae TaxID=189863 RepID=A0AAE4C7D1_9MICC|nr:hypothetical protein [Falsarthrobacter nasiphocae]MDR6891325.1 hypothetical protein [Falsarthrobacter nasiphocae]
MTLAAAAVSAAPLPERAERESHSLAVVPGIAPRRYRGLFIAAVLLLVASVGCILGINITVSRQQYSLVELKNEQTALQESNAALQETLDNAEAPQVLAAKAQKLGLVNSTSFSVVDVKTGKITSNQAVTQAEGSLPAIAAPLAPRTKAGVDPTIDAQRVKETQTGVSGADLNGGTVPAPAQQPVVTKATPKKN